MAKEYIKGRGRGLHAVAYYTANIEPEPKLPKSPQQKRVALQNLSTDWEAKFKLLAKIVHPDAGGSAEAMAIVNELNEAIRPQSTAHADWAKRLDEWLMRTTPIAPKGDKHYG